MYLDIELEILNKYEVETQEDLTNYLKEAGINVTQATVSRDIRQMKLVKVMTKSGKYKYERVKNEIYEAIKALFGLMPHRIKISY